MPKVLIAGPVVGDAAWRLLLKRVQEINTGKHGPFDLLVLVPPTSFPRPTDLPDFPLRVVTAADRVEGLRIEFFDERVAADDASPSSSNEIVDIFVSRGPPEGFEKGLGSGVPARAAGAGGDGSAAHLVSSVRRLAPRYHFSSELGFYQRPVYANKRADGSTTSTRFVSLAPVSEADATKEPAKKWLHALSLGPLPPGGEVLPAGISPSPYDLVAASAGDSQRSKPRAGRDEDLSKTRTSFIFASSEPDAKRPRRDLGPARGKGPHAIRPTRMPPRMDCWFCLASPSCEQHLVAHVGDECYVALPKGGLAVDHVLIVPISHDPSFCGLPDVVLDEVAVLQGRIEKYFKSKGFGALFCERNFTLDRAPQRHAYLECLPVPAQLTGQQVEKALLDEAKANPGMTLSPLFADEPKADEADAAVETRDWRSILKRLKDAQGSTEYIFVAFQGRAWVHRVAPPAAPAVAASSSAAPQPGKGNNKLRAPLQFGRSVACKLLGLPDRMDWKPLVGSKAQEQAWTNVVRKSLEDSAA